MSVLFDLSGEYTFPVSFERLLYCESSPVGEDEADAKANLISVNSPIARALVGKMEGDEVTVNAPGGDVTYEIDAVEHI